MADTGQPGNSHERVLQTQLTFDNNKLAASEGTASGTNGGEISAPHPAVPNHPIHPVIRLPKKLEPRDLDQTQTNPSLQGERSVRDMKVATKIHSQLTNATVYQSRQKHFPPPLSAFSVNCAAARIQPSFTGHLEFPGPFHYLR